MTTNKKAKQMIVINTEISAFGSANHPEPTHHRIMKRYASPLMGGPPKSDALLELVCQMFTQEQAELVVHLPIFRPRTAAQVAARVGYRTMEVKAILDHLAFEKKVILAVGDPSKYTILPILPGTFEMALMTMDISTRTRWHQEFAEIFERIWEMGFIKSYSKTSAQLVRYLPVQQLGPTLQKAWPSDRLEEILDRYDDFGVTHCQCRQTMDLVGKGCGKPMENCASFGPMVVPGIERGVVRRVDKAEMLAIKKEAEANGCVTWMMNAVGDVRGDISCSCCGCCCHALRTVNQFSVPGLISKPHFMPVKNSKLCTMCKKCVDVCPMGAWSIFGPRMHLDYSRCIGCGLCVVACKLDALQLEPSADARPPMLSYKSLLLQMGPGYLYNTVSVFFRRLLMNQKTP